MRKIIILVSFSSYSQDEKKSKVGFVDTFQFTFGFSNLAPNKSMIGDSNSEAFPLISSRLGIFSYSRFTAGIHASLHRMETKNNNYFGFFHRTTAFTPGFYLSYYQPVSTNGLLEPYISYDYTKYISTGYGKKELDFESDGFGLGIDYQHKLGNRAYVTLGLKYSFNKMRTETHPN